ncbi:uncharacterized protein LOC119657701 isoform X1 [Hermetia illucens]|nr:uncharacterized protein LOC119657701 isoform X1 [Hermetia illucens]XP_037920669.1 uncharacterized protein LOC119657701 isoform X1 [Hermetia illucens]
MSLRSFYVVLCLVCWLHGISGASTPLNIRKLYESNEIRTKKDDTTFPQADEDVLELEQLKLKNLENKATTTPNSNLDIDGDILTAPTVLQKQQASNKNPIVLGQPEEEEQMVVQYRPHHPIVHNAEVPRQEETATNTEKSPAKPFYGAARLTYGQNPHIEAKTTQTSTSPSTTSVSEGDHSTLNAVPSSSSPSTSSTAISSTSMNASPTNPIITESENDSSEEESVSAELEATKNGERRSLNLKSPKTAESVLRHPDGQYSSFDMAQYVFWTGDEAGVAKAVEEFIQEGLMSRENAIKFLRDIRLGIEYLQDSYANRVFPNHLKIGSLHPKTVHAPVPASPPTTTTTSPAESRPMLSPTIRKALEGIPSLLRLQEMNNDRNKENSLDYDEMSGRLRLADFLYAEYSLEEVIYQLAKVMFSESLANGSEQAQNALQRLTAFLEAEGDHGRISPALQKKILDVILNALSDVLAEHPELIAAARTGLGSSFHKLPKHIVEPIKN